LIAKALGAKVSKAPVKEIGWYDISPKHFQSYNGMRIRLPKAFSVFQWHEDTFEIPKAAKLIATSQFVPHQANLRMFQSIAKTLHLPMEKFYVTLHKYGNISSASCAIAFDEAVRDGSAQPHNPIDQGAAHVTPGIDGWVRIFAHPRHFPRQLK
jgi:hypothetical protein